MSFVHKCDILVKDNIVKKGGGGLISVLVYTGIACVIYFFLLKKKLDSGTFGGYTAFEMIVFFTLTRLCPLFMTENRTAENYIALAADALILAMVFFVFYKKFGTKAGKTAAALYMFAPLSVVGTASGDLRLILVSLFVATMLAFAYFFVKNRGRTDSHLLNGYILLTCGIYLALLAVSFREKCFTILISAGIIALVLTLVLAVRNKFFLKDRINIKKATSDIENSIASVYEKFGIKDLILMLVLTAVYAAAVFFRLGSIEAPQTQMNFSDENREIVLDLGEYTKVSHLSFFLGRRGGADIALSVFNEVTDEWMLAEKDAELKTAYCWNSVPMSWKTRYIGIVFTKAEEYHINEIAVVGADGKLILPVNSAEYPELFDEQELFPEYNSYYYGMMFDEIYHGRTAYEFLNDLPIYETTHPPLGKTIISLGIAAFGMTPFGWRFASAVCGTLVVPLMYLFCRKISGRKDIAFIGAALFCTEFMHYTLSRIATIDIIAALFILMMFFFMYCFTREKAPAKQYVWLFLCGVSTALAVSTKWTGVYAAVGIAVIFFADVFKKCAENGGVKKNIPMLSRLFAVCVLSFIIIPAAVYSLSYIQFSEVYTDKSFIEHAVSNSAAMFSYHSGAKASHPYSSEWYEWLIDKQSLLDSCRAAAEDSVSTVVTFGNPLILLVGSAAFVHNFYLWRVKKSKTSRVLVIAFLSMLMPWLFIHRTVFIYQYFVCITLFCPMICSSLMQMKKPMRSGSVLLCASLALFVMFFPVISGTAADREYVHWLEWLPTWVFE